MLSNDDILKLAVQLVAHTLPRGVQIFASEQDAKSHGIPHQIEVACNIVKETAKRM